MEALAAAGVIEKTGGPVAQSVIATSGKPGAPAAILGQDQGEAGKAGKGGAPTAAVSAASSLPPLDKAIQQNVGLTLSALVSKPSANEGTDATAFGNEVGQRLVYIPKPDVNPVLQALKAKGWYVNAIKDGTHYIYCPKAQHHADTQGTKTVYIEPDAAHPVGQLLCQHEHEEGVSINNLLTALGVSYAAARHRSCIRFVQGELSAVLHAIETELTKLGRFFHVQGMMVSVNLNTAGHTVTTPVTEQMLMQVLAAHIDFEKFDGRVKGYAPCDPQPRYVNMLLNKRDFETLPQLNGLSRQPYFMQSRDGNMTLCVKEGYNPASRLLGAFRAQDFALPEPTLANARVALDLLLELIGEFHFVKPVDRAVALSAIFTGVFRSSIGLAPGFHVRAPVISSGKSLLCNLIGLFAGPESNNKVSYPKSSEEATKTILSALLGSPSVIEFDDMTHDWLAHGVINRLFTNEWITDRILGVSKMATVSTRVLILGSGNNVGPIRDLSRRVLTCHLDPRSDTPVTLDYRTAPAELVSKNRAKYVGAVLTVAQAWFAAGSPKSSVSNIASFGGDWANFCRHPLIWLGQPDPAEALFEQLKSDPDVEFLGRLLKHWHNAFGATPKTLRSVMDELPKYLDLQDAIAEFPTMDKGEINRSKFGWLLKRNANRIVGGLMFERVDASERTSWRVVRTSTATTPSPALPPSPPLAQAVRPEAQFGNLGAFEQELNALVPGIPVLQSEPQSADSDEY